MEPKKNSKKIQLNKETITMLNEEQQTFVLGGWLDTDVDGCASRVNKCETVNCQPQPTTKINDILCVSYYICELTYAPSCLMCPRLDM